MKNETVKPQAQIYEELEYLQKSKEYHENAIACIKLKIDMLLIYEYLVRSTCEKIIGDI